ncbi:MAG: hypothetical protein ISS57_14725 [Anaerolineales bacterium]|nr:hypothetical protein [Anaerolineales bacterium]
MRFLLPFSLLLAVFLPIPVGVHREDAGTQIIMITDVCSSTPVGIALEDWLVEPEGADELVTAEAFTHLGGVLIQSGFAEAASCPDGGLLSNGKASPCGMTAAGAEVIAWQNIFDEAIYQTAGETHVPARLLKGMFAQESQFWPGSKLGFEYGLGHLTRSGVDTTLIWSPELYAEVCQGTLGMDCHRSGSYFDYLMEDSLNRGTLLAETLERINPDCPQCTGGVDKMKAENSVRIFGWSLLAHCRQTSQVIYNATGHIPLAVTDYPTLWRLGLYAYNAGAGCLYETLVEAWSPGEILSWEQFAGSAAETCRFGVGYVDRVLDYAARTGEE